MGRLACDATLSARIAAFAPVSGAYYIDALTTDAECADPAAVDIPCDAGRSGIPIMAFHGGADPTIDYEGGLRTYCLPAVRHWAEAWADRNGLNVSEVDNSTIAGSDNGVVSSWGGGLVNLVYDGDDIEHDVSHSRTKWSIFRFVFSSRLSLDEFGFRSLFGGPFRRRENPPSPKISDPH